MGEIDFNKGVTRAIVRGKRILFTSEIVFFFSRNYTKLGTPKDSAFNNRRVHRWITVGMDWGMEIVGGWENGLVDEWVGEWVGG